MITEPEGKTKASEIEDKYGFDEQTVHFLVG